MPYRSEAQERWAHTPAGRKALGGAAAVAEWDSASKGKRLPARKSGKSSGKGSSRSFKFAEQGKKRT